VVHRRGASPATVTTPKTVAAWQPAAGLCRARRCADRTSAAASGRSAMKQSGLGGPLLGSPARVLRKDIRFGLEPHIVLRNLEEIASTPEGFFHHAHRGELVTDPG